MILNRISHLIFRFNRKPKNMKIIYLLITALSICFGCQSNNKTINKDTNDTIVNIPVDSSLNARPSSIDSIAAKQWLKDAINNYFTAENPDMQSLTTATYYDFKMDAMNVDLDVDGGLSQDEFKKKWQQTFDLSKHSINIGFLISGNDYTVITVDKCEVIPQQDPKKIVFHTILTDKDFKTSYIRDIILEAHNNSFLISDVIEYE